ncbi:MAG: sugar phosphate isomerase/epimerase [Devosia nanyangense]|uniref:Sugar phosphate isomerase/epimerase n=1 Tax=Devosia nanyangense TaxID=1228055 RepID=A0A933NXV6_9HYPH|nr:sugar phosphate isomerase/epimerase [Devosia nanyangense]
MPPIVCSSHTISGVMPGGVIASRHRFEDRVKACAEAGFDGMCLHFRDYAEQRAAGKADKELRAVLDEFGMVENSVEFLRDWFRPEGEANIRLALSAAGAFGARHINVSPDLDDEAHPIAAMGPAFAALCDRAADRGVGVALELVAWGNVRTLDRALALLDLGGANAGLIIDSWHVFRAGIGLDELATLSPARIGCVQLSDAAATVVGPLSCDTMSRRFCGEGALDLRGLLDTLARMGVAAPLAVEVISPEAVGMVVQEAARRAFETTMRVVGDSRLTVGARG